MKRKKGVITVKRLLLSEACYRFTGNYTIDIAARQWHRLGFPKLEPGESCKVKVTIERVK